LRLCLIGSMGGFGGKCLEMSAAPQKPAPAGAQAPKGAAAQPEAPAQPAATPAPATSQQAPRRPRVDWKSVWPIPLAIGSVALLGAGIVIGIKRMPTHDPELPLARTRAQVGSEDYVSALGTLNAELLPLLNTDRLSTEQQREFYQLRGRSLMFGQEKLGVSEPENYRGIIEAFDAGRRLGLVLEPTDTAGLVQAHLALGQTDKAVALTRSLAGQDEARRLRLYRQIVEETLRGGEQRGAQKDPNMGIALELLAELLEMPDLPLKDRAWVVARQAELRLAGGFADEAAVRLLRDVNKFDALDKESKAELLFLLGKSYSLAGMPAEAVQYLLAAERDLPGFDERRAESGVLRAQAQQGWGQNEDARELFEAVAKGFAESPWQVPALLGLAETHGALGDSKSSLEAFREVIAAVGTRKSEGKDTGGITYELIGERLLDRSQDKHLQGSPNEALAYALAAQDAYRAAGSVPAAVHLALALANRGSAEKIIKEAGLTGAARPDWSAISPVTATEAKGFLIDAGENYRQHSRLITSADYDAMMESLWNAGESFDLAGDAEGAIESFSTFLQGARADYPKRSEGVFRLGQVYESQGTYNIAAGLYEQLIAQRDNPQGFAGVWADRSIVPLARCLINDTGAGPESAANPEANPEAKPQANPEAKLGEVAPGAKEGEAKVEAGVEASKRGARNQERAIELLTTVIDGGRLLEPEAEEYLQALAELGELHYRRGEYAQAIARLRDAVRRDPDSARAATLRYKMADAHRLSAVTLGEEANDEPLVDRRARAAERLEHLREAEQLYRTVAADLGRKPSGRLSKMEQLIRRNAVFYAADCVYMAGNFAEAVRQYLAARDQYPTDPASMMGLVQTVSSLVKLQRWDEAQAVHERAKALLASMPDSVWNEPDRLLPMERRHWEAWLESRLQLEQHTRAKSQPDTTAAVPTP